MGCRGRSRSPGAGRPIERLRFANAFGAQVVWIGGALGHANAVARDTGAAAGSGSKR